MPALIEWSYSVASPAAVAATTLARAVAVTPVDYATDPVTGDLAIPLRLVTGADAVAQRLAIRLGFFKGAWFLDTREGIPYIAKVFIRNPNLPLIEALFRKVIRTTPAVDRIASYVHSLDNRTRTYNARARIEAAGQTIVLTNKPLPFIVGDK